MGVLGWLHRLYAVETLDTRFEASRERERCIKVEDSQWRTLEFGLYGAVFAVVVPGMFYVVYGLSQRKWSIHQSILAIMIRFDKRNI